MSNINWSALSLAFKYLCVSMSGNGSKLSDGTMEVSYHNDNMWEKTDVVYVSVTFWAYCMPEMAKRDTIGPFTSEERLFARARQKLQQQIRFINAIRLEDSLGPIQVPDILKETEEEAKINKFMFEQSLCYKERALEAGLANMDANDAFKV